LRNERPGDGATSLHLSVAGDDGGWPLKVLLTFLLRLFAVAVSALSMTGCGVPGYYLGEVSGVVLDAKTQEPISGAIVIAHWQLERQTLHGTVDSGQLRIEETVTNANGEYRFREGFFFNPFLRMLRAADPEVLAFKAGYEMDAGLLGFVEGYDALNFKRKPKTINLRLAHAVATPGAHGSRELYNSVNAGLHAIMRDCSWRKIPNTVKYLEEVRAAASTSDPALRVRLPEPGAGEVDPC
jgi:hypothetical protein